jgi:hypothetical protein
MAWGFSTHEQLTAAGYTWRRGDRCVKCSRRILWYTNPSHNFVPVDPGTYTLHFATCKPPAPPANVIPFAKPNRQLPLLVEPEEAS